MDRQWVTRPVRYQCHLVFSSLVSSSRCRDPTRSATTLPPIPHRLVGKLLVGSCLGTTVPPPSALTMSPGSHHVVAMQQLLSLVTAYSRCPSHIAASSSPSQGRLTTMTRRCGRFTRLSVGWPKWFSNIHIILERS
jgi:hypothetical protein